MQDPQKLLKTLPFHLTHSLFCHLLRELLQEGIPLQADFFVRERLFRSALLWSLCPTPFQNILCVQDPLPHPLELLDFLPPPLPFSHELFETSQFPLGSLPSCPPFFSSLSRLVARASVKKSSSTLKLSLKRLGTSQDVQIVDDGTAAQIKEILAEPAVAGTSTLPLTNMGQRMLHGHPFAQFGPSLWGLLALAQLDEQGFIGMDADTTSLRTGSQGFTVREKAAQLDSNEEVCYSEKKSMPVTRNEKGAHLCKQQ